MKAETLEDLVKQAQRAQKRAYAPYSKYKVGAAILGASGKIYWGVNVENASYGLSMCAERAAIFAGVTSGETSFSVIAVVADGEEVPMPCGACRQVMEEFSIPWVVLGNMKKERKLLAFESLLPLAFGKSYLTEQEKNDGEQ
jgi:cytidine deaminase, homotetrameric